jgi:hypothetical protein
MGGTATRIAAKAQGITAGAQIERIVRALDGPIDTVPEQGAAAWCCYARRAFDTPRTDLSARLDRAPSVEARTDQETRGMPTSFRSGPRSRRASLSCPTLD